MLHETQLTTDMTWQSAADSLQPSGDAGQPRLPLGGQARGGNAARAAPSAQVSGGAPVANAVAIRRP